MRSTKFISHRITTTSASALALAIAFASPAYAQAGPNATNSSPAEEAGAEDTGAESEIVVTGSRIARAGFDQPTPTTVVGEVELRQGARTNLQQILNEQPQIRNTTSQEGSAANTSSGTAPVDLRGLGSNRTLTLINGRRFIGDNNLNFVPVSLVDRIEVVTGGASAAWGSGAVAGVVNIILNDELEGLSLGASTGISSRGDGGRYTVDGSFGTSFADDRAHFMIGAEYVNDDLIGPRGMADRPWFGADFVNVPGGRELRPDVDPATLVVGGTPITYGGTILSGPLAGGIFNADGTLRSAQPGDVINIFETINVRSPLERIAGYARLSYDIGANATIWADASYGKSIADQPFLPDTSVATLSIGPNNPFLSPAVRAQLGGQGFVLGRLSTDVGFIQFRGERETIEGAIGIDGSFGGGWTYNAHFSHGQIKGSQRLPNSLIPSRFNRAVDAVQTAGGIVCAVNADASTTNDDPACVAFNPFGFGAASPEAMAYVAGTQSLDTTNKLDSAAVEIQGDLLSLWAGPVTVAVGAEARWEEQVSENGDLDRQSLAGAGGLPASVFGTPLFFTTTSGKTDVKEAFGEALVPLLDTEAVKADLNGAARYSDYSLSGGIWSWKVGGTVHLFDSLLFRATRSRDIRAPGIGELYAQNSLNIRRVNDRDTSRCIDRPDGDPLGDCNPNPQVTLLTSGNPDLVPEVSKTWTVGGSFSPSFLSGFNLSVDYYDIAIAGAIQAPDTQDITIACLEGDQASCALVDRAPNGTITTVRARQANIASLRTNGVDIEASYLLRLPSGTLSLRGLASWVDKLVFETPACLATDTCRQTAGSVGDTVLSGVPHWRGNLGATYQTDAYGLDVRARYVGGGKYDASPAGANIVNNDIDSRIYVDVGAQFHVTDQFTLFGNVRNLFDRAPPLTVQLGGFIYDSIGRYFTAGARVKF